MTTNEELNAEIVNTGELTREDFISDQMVKWCPGCGGHAILSATAKVFPKLGIKKENFVMVSGIGCSSRFPYYVHTYGFHGIHGRAAAIASGVKIQNPELSVWVITGDGDAMAIGGNHFIHLIRRNIDINVLLFNNKIYGLTKGQYSPTSPRGSITKSSPQGTIENPFNPGELVIGASGTFYAKVVDTDPKMMSDVIYEAATHKGTSIVEILENCVIYNNQVHAEVTAKENKDNAQLHLEHGKPMLFGANKEKGIRMNGSRFEVVELGKNGITENDILVHDKYEKGPGIHHVLARMGPPNFPIPLGVIRSVTKHDSYEVNMEAQIKEEREKNKIKNVDDLLNSGTTWFVK